MKQIVSIFIICISLGSCGHLDVFEKTVIIPRQIWYNNYKPSFSFVITDTLSAYNIFIVLRHTDAYRYNNIWLNVLTRAPGDTIQAQNFDIILGSDAKGWTGNGMDDIFELRKNITRGPVPFKRAGSYTFTVGHIMRENPLNHILNVGIRVEKVHL